MPGARPVPVMVSSIPGAMRGTGRKLAASTRFEALNCGPGGLTVRLNVVVMPPAAAVMTTGPGVLPAVTLIVASPWAFVVALGALNVADPLVTVKVPGTPEAAAPAAFV